MALHRTPTTWAIYGANGAWASFVYLSGPVAPVVADALGVPLTVAGLVGTGLAAGLATSSVTTPPAIRAFNRDGAMKLAFVVLAVALLGMILIPPAISGTAGFAVLVGLVWVASTAGGTVMNAGTARLSDAYPHDSAEVITEANAAAAWVGLFSPLLLGLALRAGLGWQAGVSVSLLAALAALGGLYATRRLEGESEPVPADVLVPQSDSPPAARLGPGGGRVAPGVEAAGAATATPGTTVASHGLPRAFWVAMVALFAAAATEFAVNFWGSTLIVSQTDAEPAAATAAMTASVAGVAIGRTVGSFLVARLGSHRVLLGGFTMALAGFAVLWSSHTLALSVVGLLVIGLGLATLFPLVLDRGILLSGGQADVAMSRSALVLGLAIGGAPFALGALGAVVPVQAAMLLVPCFVVAGLVGVVRSRPN